MAEAEGTGGGGAAQDPAVDLAIDTSVAHPARVYDYWLGGKDNFAADREAAESVLAVSPGLRWRVQANRRFLARAVRYLAEEAGIGQFLDIGTGIPSANNTHQVAQQVRPDARIVYVDNDPIVLSHARALLTSGPHGATQYVHGDVREPGPIITAATETLDLSQPVALMLIGVLHLIQDSEDPWGLVAWLMAQLPAGSYLAISHPAIDIAPGQAEVQRRYNERVSTPQTLRDRDQVARFFAGLELVEPGLVYVHAWRPGEFDTAPQDATSAWGGVARKP
ncbi:MAG TPA: SAM-dependent methyltransferase [Streptosporangiaceae bacterium]